VINPFSIDNQQLLMDTVLQYIKGVVLRRDQYTGNCCLRKGATRGDDKFFGKTWALYRLEYQESKRLSKASLADAGALLLEEVIFSTVVLISKKSHLAGRSLRAILLVICWVHSKRSEGSK